MADKFGLKVGVQVDIKRSDGRVHRAVISGINEQTDTVTVEWFENEETKGKELDVRHIAQYNPDLAPAIQRALQDKEVRSAAPPAAIPKIPKASAIPAPAPAAPRAVAAAAAAAPAPSYDDYEDEEDDYSRGGGAAAKPRAPKAGGGGAGAAAKVGKAAQEVQKMAEKREARRAQQAEKRDEIQLRNGMGPHVDFAEMIDEFREPIVVRRLPPSGPVKDSRITVCVRKRPLNSRERSAGDLDVVTIPDGEITYIHEPKTKVDLTRYLENHQFVFDYSFDEMVENATVYHYSAKPLVRTIFEQGMATCFAYGQTGSGKTHTMGGSFTSVKDQNASQGIYALAAADVFRLNQSPEFAKNNLTVNVSFFEIYGGKVFDLLNGQKRLRVLEDAKNIVQIVGLAEKPVSGLKDVIGMLEAGMALRASGSTAANQNSSRSHAIFQLILRTPKRQLFGKLSLIDLAGNERGADTANADRQTRLEGAEINKSLLALKECIRALGRKGSHTPFRASKLTQVLRDSFIGANARTCMIAMISPGKNSCEHSLNTLRYADRVKELGPKRSGAGDSETVDDDDDRSLEEGDGEPEDAAAPASLVKQDLRRLHHSLRVHGESKDDSNEVFQFHKAVAQVVEFEERIVDEHRAALQFDKEMLAEEERLLEEVDGVSYDVDKYAKRLDDILATKIDKLQQLRANVGYFRKQLQAEEQISKNVNKLRF
eukprot:m.15458 g.15458  ORF g.15458 m.15458 type:complete len:711 (+) comp6681_c0_seq1:28-2160(+)